MPSETAFDPSEPVSRIFVQSETRSSRNNDRNNERNNESGITNNSNSNHSGGTRSEYDTPKEEIIKQIFGNIGELVEGMII